MKIDHNTRIYLAGHRGLVGSAIDRQLRARGVDSVIRRTHSELDLTDATAVQQHFKDEQPQVVILAAARVGGIFANSHYPADFIRENLQIQTNVIDAAYHAGVQKLVFLGSSCIYPKLAPQPIPESALLSSPLEPTNQWYAIAKIAGIKMCQAYREQYGFNAISLMPTNLYGPGDNFDPKTSHVLPAMIRKFHDAKVKGEAQVSLWGSGSPRREFMHVDDLGDAILYLLEHYDDGDILNIGVGEDIRIRELAELIRDIVGFKGEIVFDTSMPDGTPRKLVDSSKLQSLGWRPRIPLAEGITSTYEWFLAHHASTSDAA